ncbi:sugar transferase [bacterium]|nr:sugar transferase [bacterium]
MILRRQTEKTAGQIIWLGFFILPIIGFSFAWWFRFKSGLFQVIDLQPYDEYKIPILIVAFFWVFAFGMRNIHHPELQIGKWREFVKITGASIIALIFPMAISFTYRGYFYSRLVMALGSIFTLALCFIYKESAKIILKKLVLKRIGVAKKLIIGCGEFAEKVVDAIRKDPLTAAGLVGMVSLPGERCTAELSYLGDVEDIRKLLIEKGFDEVILANPQTDEDTILNIIYECRKEQVQFELVPQYWHLLRGHITVEEIGELRATAFADLALKSWQKIVKRIIDISISTISIILFLPIIITVAFAIKLTSEGSVFFRQERIGRNGRKFKMMKFRSMYNDAEKRLKKYLDKNEASGPIFKIKHDPRITPIGKFLRRFSIDELPQIFNVFAGQMSLVGPRPPLEREIIKYKNWQLKRIDVTPGMTGLWQVSGRSDLPFDKMAELDIYYIEHWSIWMDIKILFKTIPAVLSGRGAY